MDRLMKLGLANRIADEPKNFSDQDLVDALLRLDIELRRYQMSIEILKLERKKRKEPI